jgi:hypothetical protein
VVSGRFFREALALVLVLLAIVSVIALFAPDAGAIVRPWHGLLSTLLGWGIAFAAPLLAGFAVMLWMKTMPAERWMAASGAALVALALLGMFHLAVGGGSDAVAAGQGGGAIGLAAISWPPTWRAATSATNARPRRRAGPRRAARAGARRALERKRPRWPRHAPA